MTKYTTKGINVVSWKTFTMWLLCTFAATVGFFAYIQEQIEQAILEQAPAFIVVFLAFGVIFAVIATAITEDDTKENR